jgi:CRP/FNR family transcriptional regulator, cyclic AMP receptor protein
MPAETSNVVESLAQLTLFADLTQPRLEEVAHTVGEELFPGGQRVLRQGMSGGGLFIILEGEAEVVIDGDRRARLGRGDFFGEIAALTGDAPTADVVAATMLRCATVPGPELEAFLHDHPTVMFRMLKAEARRLRSANEWQR